MKQELVLTNKQEEIRDSILKQALENAENFEGIKSGIIRNGALAFFHSGVQKSKIAILLVKTLVSNDMHKKTLISKSLIYKVLRHPEFKTLKSENHAKSKRGRGRNQNPIDLLSKSIQIQAPTCLEVIAQEVKKIREQNQGLSNKEIRDMLKNLDSIRQFSPGTLCGRLATLLPIYEQHKKPEKETPPTVATIPVGLTQDILDEQQQEQNLIKQLELLQQVIEWLSGMSEGQRTQFYKDLPKGQAYTLALQEKCRNHIIILIKMMPEKFLSSFLQYTDEITHLIKIWDEKLYEEKQFRQSKRDITSI